VTTTLFAVLDQVTEAGLVTVNVWGAGPEKIAQRPRHRRYRRPGASIPIEVFWAVE